MNDRPPSAQSADDQVLEEIFQHAKPRPRPSPVARERAFSELQSEWHSVIAGRKRQRATAWALAASLVVVVIAGGFWWTENTTEVPDFSASIARSTGAGVNLNGRLQDDAALANARLHSGDHLRTAAGSRVAVRWPGGGSLRLDGDTRLRLAANNAVELQSGGLYFDSTPFGDYQAGPSTIQLQTPLGLITHKGTQFQARLADGNLELAVREGEAHLTGNHIDASVVAGKIIFLSRDGTLRQADLSGHDERWQWAADIAPKLQLNGRTTHEVLNWIGRETGRSVRYRSAEARRIADSEPRGIGELPPMPALRTIPVMTSLSVTVDKEKISVDVAAVSPQH